MQKEFGGIVLCGGKSSRFGSNKGSYSFRNKELVKYSIDLLKEFTKQIIVVGPEIVKDKSVQYKNDIFKNLGPMGGLHAGLLGSEKENNIVLACDIPFVKSSIIAQLIDFHTNTDISIFQTPDNKYHPLLGIYSKNIIAELEKNLSQKKNKMIDFILQQNHRIIKLKETDQLDSFININYLHEAKKYQ